ncbi:MAG: DUF4838 domain-containing protein [Lentisphaerae bacterium]|nr:DUF4838 domain-containing protein [Lentisphaerota bacterium]
MKRTLIRCLLLLFIPVVAMAEAPPRVVLAEGGEARLSIVIPAEASPRHQATAASLADMLGRLSGAVFMIATNAPQVPAIHLRIAEGPRPEISAREHYSIRSDADGLTLIGVTDLALEHAVWDLLHRFGYRQFFPGKTWEVIPQTNSLAIALNIAEAPDYQARRIWYGYGSWGNDHEAWQEWNRRNRMANGVKIVTGHAYGRIIRHQQAAFDAHPEYYALLNGERNVTPQAKLCIGNPDLRRVVVDDALAYFENDPEADCVSVDPSDGGGWCECERCQAIGPASDRALLLANDVAAAVQETFPGKLVGMYAYNVHSTPPHLRVHPNVVISVATAFIKNGLKVEDIIAGWAEKGATLGVREYYSVSTWDRDMPGRARGSNLDYLSETIPDFHARGIRYMSSQASENWGCNGLGYYYASRVLWDVEAAKRRDEIVEDFLERCFGGAKEPMRAFYALIDGSNKQAQLVFADLLARMFRRLSEARVLAGADEAVQRRIDDLVLYTRHAELYDRYRVSRGEERQSAYEAMIQHAYRIRGTHMVDSLALYRDVHTRDKSIVVPDEATWTVPEANNPWKSSEPFSKEEIAAMLHDAMAAHQPVELDFEPKEFSDEDLVPATKGREFAILAAGKAETARSSRSWFTVVESAPAEIELTITGGLIPYYRDRGHVKIQVWKLGGASETGERKTLVAEDSSVPPDGNEHTVTLALKDPGTYRIDLDDGGDLTRVTWPEGQWISWKMAMDDHPQSMHGRWHLYFYVPKGTKRIGLYSAASAGSLLQPDGNPVLDLGGNRTGEFLSVVVPAGMDDQLWKVDNVLGNIYLLNVPPFLAKTAEQLVLPRVSIESQ